ncbi:UNKNOWN [Stylonychia lemnae]|uniref:Transmembrane protein n=1 Tax=Stylonychia lemnae TaxID=5949 RepID=A0A078B7C8_STYLE|nr:UNKNOWN [Stylonychia lemnae]|eukprot:CDW90116.1 UNKNOWN [Stylonychia lemnae]
MDRTNLYNQQQNEKQQEYQDRTQEIGDQDQKQFSLDGQQKQQIKLRMIDKEEVKKQNQQRREDYNRMRNFELLMNLRPGVFDPQDQIKNEEIRGNIRWTAVFVFFGFISTSAFRFWQIKTGHKEIGQSLMIIMASYMPSISYYNYYKKQHNLFLRDVANRYKDRINEDEFKRFQREAELGDAAKEINSRQIPKKQ